MIDGAGERPCWFSQSGDGKHLPNTEKRPSLPTVPAADCKLA
jgi:hypothetical protein